MTHLRLTLLAVLFAVVGGVLVSAQQSSVTYMALVTSPQFLNRVAFMVAQTAPVIEAEAAGPQGAYTETCHQLRTSWATAVIRSPMIYAPVFAVSLVTTGAVTTAGALTGSGATLDTPATDGALFSAVGAMWSALSGCITTP